MKTTSSMGFWEAVMKGLDTSSLGKERGRVRRSEFWWRALFFAVCSLIVDAIAYFLGENGSVDEDTLELLSVSFYAYMGGSFFYCLVRRLNDTGRSALLANTSLALGCTALLLNFAYMFFSIGIFHVLEIVLYVLAAVVFVAVLVICTFDSEKQKNRYGYSDKYVDEEDHPGMYDKLFEEYGI